MNNDNAPLVSVIVPVFNTEKYLKRCLDSLLDQTLSQIEIIIIDDGSTDGSAAICRKYAEADRRIVFVSKKNEGLSAARNDGIEMASAQYLMFVDSDDWTEPDFCSVPYMIAEDNDADMVLFNYRSFKDGRQLRMPGVNAEEHPLDKTKAMEIIHGAAGCFAWNKLYRRCLFDDVKYPEGRAFEDMGTTYRLVDRAERIFCTDAYLYNYTAARPGSISMTGYIRNMKDWVEMWSQKKTELSQMGYDMSGFIGWEAFYFLIHFGRIKNITDVLEEEVDRIKGYPEPFNKKQKVMLAVYRISPEAFDIVCRLLGRRAVKIS